jgi:hypothetical protein
MIIISQGKPNPPYFVVAQPAEGSTVRMGDQVKCINPKNKEETTGVCVDWWTMSWGEIPDSFTLLTFGVDVVTLRKALSAKRKAYRDKEEVRFLLIQETK